MDQVDRRPSLYALYLGGATLIVEHLAYRREGDEWHREEVHRVVGYEPEMWTLPCNGPDDHSDTKGPPDDDDARVCELCRRHRVHTKSLHWARAGIDF